MTLGSFPVSYDFLVGLIGGVWINVWIATIALLLGVVAGVPLAFGLVSGLPPARWVASSTTGLARAAPTFVILYFLFNWLNDHVEPGAGMVVSSTMMVALALAPYAAAYIADNGAEAIRHWRDGAWHGVLLFVPNLVRAFFVMLMSSGIGAAIGVHEGISIIIRQAERTSGLLPRMIVYAVGIVVFGLVTRFGFLLAETLKSALHSVTVNRTGASAPINGTGGFLLRRFERLNSVGTQRYALLILGSLVLIAAVRNTMPPSVVVIEAGPRGGGYDITARHYRDALRPLGFDVQIIYQPDSSAIITDVDTRQNGASVGFTTLEPSSPAPREIVSLGSIEVQPIFIIYSLRMGYLNSATQLLHHRIALPPEQSATSEAAKRILRHFNIDQSNAEWMFMSIDEAAQALLDGRCEVGIFMLSPENPIIARLLREGDLRVLPLNDAVAISRMEPDLRPINLPAHIYDLQNNEPPVDVPMLGATINVVVHKSLHPSVVYALLEAMEEIHSKPTFVSAAGEFPGTNNLAVSLSSLAKDFYKNGRPWIHRYLPLSLAGFVDHYLPLFLMIVVGAEAYKFGTYIFGLFRLMKDLLALHLLHRINKQLRSGGSLNGSHRALFRVARSMIARTSHQERGEDLIEQIEHRISSTS